MRIGARGPGATRRKNNRGGIIVSTVDENNWLKPPPSVARARSVFVRARMPIITPVWGVRGIPSIIMLVSSGSSPATGRPSLCGDLRPGARSPAISA
eukprot:6554920-Heterocapsa_arctica.AAC.1